MTGANVSIGKEVMIGKDVIMRLYIIIKAFVFLVEYRIRSDGFPFVGGRLCGREASNSC